MAEQLDEIPEWTVSEQFLEEKLQKKECLQENGQSGEDLSENFLSNDTEKVEEDPGNYLPGEMRTPDNGEETASNTLDIPEEMDIEDLMDEVHSDSKVSSSLAQPDVPEKTDWNTLSSFPDGSPVPVECADDEYELSSLLERLDLTENIRRMNESAQEDIADVIERESEPVELSAAVPAVLEDAGDIEDAGSVEIEFLQPQDYAEEPVDEQVDDLEFDMEADFAEEPENDPAIDQTDISVTESEEKDEEETVQEIEPAVSPDPDPTEEPVNEPEETLEFDMETEIESKGEPIKLPKYKKPEFSLELVGPGHESEEEERVEISEYDMVPTIDGLEKKWKGDGSDPRMQEHISAEPVYVAEETVQPAAKENEAEHSNGFAYSLADIMPASTSTAPEIHDEETEPVPLAPKKTVSFDVQPERHSVHTEEIIKKSGGARRAYHRIIL